MLTPNPLVWAGALTQVVRRANIALLGPVLLLNNPVSPHEEVDMLDAISGGGVIDLFLRGVPKQDARPLRRRRAGGSRRRSPGIDLVIKAWTAPEPFAWEGEHHRYGLVSIWPQPFQKPHPPVFGSGNSEESVVFAAQRQLGLAISFAPVEQVARAVSLYRAEAEKAGWSPGPDHILYRAVAQVSESDGAHPSPAGGEGIFRPFFHGGPKSVIGQVESLRGAVGALVLGGAGCGDCDVVIDFPPRRLGGAGGGGGGARGAGAGDRRHRLERGGKRPGGGRLAAHRDRQVRQLLARRQRAGGAGRAGGAAALGGRLGHRGARGPPPAQGRRAPRAPR